MHLLQETPIPMDNASITQKLKRHGLAVDFIGTAFKFCKARERSAPSMQNLHHRKKNHLGDEQKKIRSGCLTRAFSGAASGMPSASERGTKSKVARLWVRWLLNPCRLGNPLRFRAGDKIKSGPTVGKVAT